MATVTYLSELVSAVAGSLIAGTTLALIVLITAALAAEKAFSDLKAPVLRIALANCPAPVSLKLEQAFYPKASTIARAALATLGHDPNRVGDLTREDHFKGPIRPCTRWGVTRRQPITPLCYDGTSQ
jgi:hypothetical protein